MSDCLQTKNTGLLIRVLAFPNEFIYKAVEPESIFQKHPLEC